MLPSLFRMDVGSTVGALLWALEMLPRPVSCVQGCRQATRIDSRAVRVTDEPVFENKFGTKLPTVNFGLSASESRS